MKSLTRCLRIYWPKAAQVRAAKRGSSMAKSQQQGKARQAAGWVCVVDQEEWEGRKRPDF